MQSYHIENMQSILLAWMWYPLPSNGQAINDLKVLKTKLGYVVLIRFDPISIRKIKQMARWCSRIEKVIAENNHQNPVENRYIYMTFPLQERNIRFPRNKRKKESMVPAECRLLWQRVVIISMQVTNILILRVQLTYNSCKLFLSHKNIAIIFLLDLSQFVTLTRALFPRFGQVLFHLSSFHMNI